MGSNSYETQLAVLDALNAAGLPYAVLHSLDEMVAGELKSDLDLMVDQEPDLVVTYIGDYLRDAGVELLFVWESDAGTLNTFWWRSRDRSGCQVDLLYDSRGNNRFGFKTGIAWRHVRREGEFPVLAPPAQTAYLLAKRLAKGQVGRLRRLLQDGEPYDSSLLAPRIRVLLTIPKIWVVSGPFGYATNARSKTLRLRHRLMTPQGIIVPVIPEVVRDNESQLREVLVRFRVGARTVFRALIARFIPSVTFAPSPTGLNEQEMLERLSEWAWLRISNMGAARMDAHGED